MSTTIWPPFDIPKRSFVVVTDELGAPADFLVYQVVNGWVKEKVKERAVGGGEASKTGGRVLVLSSGADLARWKAVSAKSVRAFQFTLGIWGVRAHGEIV